jgi:hypothetical protein
VEQNTLIELMNQGTVAIDLYGTERSEGKPLKLAASASCHASKLRGSVVRRGRGRCPYKLPWVDQIHQFCPAWYSSRLKLRSPSDFAEAAVVRRTATSARRATWCRCPELARPSSPPTISARPPTARRRRVPQGPPSRARIHTSSQARIAPVAQIRFPAAGKGNVPVGTRLRPPRSTMSSGPFP